MKYSENIIQAFLMYDKIKDIAEATGKSPRTICNYKKDDELQRVLTERRTEYVKTAVYKMQSTINKVTDTLISIIDDKETATQTRVNAINIFYTQCSNWTQAVDVMERLQRLEELQASNTDNCDV